MGLRIFVFGFNDTGGLALLSLEKVNVQRIGGALPLRIGEACGARGAYEFLFLALIISQN